MTVSNVQWFPHRIQVFGDSFTQGLVASKESTIWRNVLTRTLGDRYKRACINTHAYGGDGSPLRSLVEQFLLYNPDEWPDLVIIQDAAVSKYQWIHDLETGGATGTTDVTGSTVTGINLTAPGSGYLVDEHVYLKHSGGWGALGKVTSVDADGGITGIDVAYAGDGSSGYTNGGSVDLYFNDYGRFMKQCMDHVEANSNRNTRLIFMLWWDDCTALTEPLGTKNYVTLANDLLAAHSYRDKIRIYNMRDVYLTEGSRALELTGLDNSVTDLFFLNETINDDSWGENGIIGYYILDCIPGAPVGYEILAFEDGQITIDSNHSGDWTTPMLTHKWWEDDGGWQTSNFYAYYYYHPLDMGMKRLSDGLIETIEDLMTNEPTVTRRARTVTETVTVSGYLTELNTITEAGDASNQLSAWKLGFVTEALLDKSTYPYGQLYYSLSNSGSTRTVSIFSDAAGSSKIAEGSRSGDGVIDLLPQNSSGVYGYVTVAYSGDIAVSAATYLRFSSSVALSWTHAVTSPSEVVVKRRKSTDMTWTDRARLAGDATSFTDTTVREDTTYVYKITVRKAGAVSIGYHTLSVPKVLAGFRYPFEDKDGVIYGCRNSGGYPTKVDKLENDGITFVRKYLTNGFLSTQLFIDHKNRFFSTGNGGNGYGNGYIVYTDVIETWPATQKLLNSDEPDGFFVPRAPEAIEAGDASNQLSAWKLYGYNADNSSMADASNAFKFWWELTKSGSTVTVKVFKDSGKAAETLVCEGSIEADSGTITLGQSNSSGITGSVVVAYTADDTDAENTLIGGKGSWYHGWGMDVGFTEDGRRIWVIGNLSHASNPPYVSNTIHYSFDGLNFKTIAPLVADRHVHNVKYNPYNGWWYITSGDTNKALYVTRNPHDPSSYVRVLHATRDGLGGFTGICFTPKYVLFGTDDGSGNKVYRLPVGKTSDAKKSDFQVVLDFTNIARLTSSRCWDMASTPDGRIFLSTWHENVASTVSSIWSSPDEGTTWREILEGAQKSTPNFFYLSRGYNNIIRSNRVVVSCDNYLLSYALPVFFLANQMGKGQMVNGMFDTNLDGWDHGSSWAWDRIAIRDGPYGGNWGAAKCLDLDVPLSQDFGGYIEGTVEAWFSLPDDSFVAFDVIGYLGSDIVNIETKEFDARGGELYPFPGYIYSKTFRKISKLEIKVTRLESSDPEWWPSFAVLNVRVS